MQAPAEDEQDVRAVLARGRLERAVSSLLHGRLEVRVPRVEVFNLDDAPPPDQLASAASQYGNVVAVVDVVAIDYSAPGQGEREVVGGGVADPQSASHMLPRRAPDVCRNSSGPFLGTAPIGSGMDGRGWPVKTYSEDTWRK